MTLEDLEPAGLFLVVLMYEQFRRWWLWRLLEERSWSEQRRTLFWETFFQGWLGAIVLGLAWAWSENAIYSLLFIALAAWCFWGAWSCWRAYRSL